ncbi:MAG: sugar ABC transporter substrate-binding protein [Verrucomicrobiales bacterium]
MDAIPTRFRQPVRRRQFTRTVGAAAAALALPGCGPSGPRSPTLGISFETLQTEFWVAGYAALKAECARRGYAIVEAVADGDANRQLDQVKNFITRGVDGIIMVPKDATTCLPIIRAANDAGKPIVLFNRPAGPSDTKATAVVADNLKLARETVEFMLTTARATGRRLKAMILLGDLGDANGVARRDGFDAAVQPAADIVEVVARVPTEWNQEKAQAGVVNALQAHPDIGFIFTSSDFLFPSIVSALKSAGKYHPTGHPGHIVLGGFDGDATAYRMLVDGFLDATGVQDVYFEAQQCVQTIDDLRAGKPVSALILDPGFVIHQGNLKEMAPRMWGSGQSGAK